MAKVLSNLSPSTKKHLADVALFIVSQVVFYYAFKKIMAAADPTRSKRREAKDKSRGVLCRFGLQGMKLSEYEEIIATEMVHADEIAVRFDQIGGLDHVIQSLKESVILPLRHPKLFTTTSGLLGAPKGVLLYGPPGCGKTMLAKALAKESDATFINLHVSTLMDKWFGESNKLVSALFTLARKLQPAIIFIDEIDAFLRERRSTDHEVTGMMKAEFMSMWDGLTTGEDTRIVILGATNRPQDIDSAILRRMPKRFKIGTPNDAQRRDILKLVGSSRKWTICNILIFQSVTLSGTRLFTAIDRGQMLEDIRLDPDFDFDVLVKCTEGASGSDLKEICRNAAMVPVREYVRTHKEAFDAPEGSQDFSVRPLRIADFFDKADGEMISSTIELEAEPQD